MALVRLDARPNLAGFTPVPRWMAGAPELRPAPRAPVQLAAGELAAAVPRARRAVWDRATLSTTLFGDEVSDRTVHFSSQADQIRFLRQMIDEYRAHPTIRALARDIVFRIFRADQRNEVGYAIAVGSWVQQQIRYVRELPEVFQTPLMTLSMLAGDCDDHAALVGALIESLGISAELVGMEWTAGGGRAFQHIWTRARVTGSDGRTVRVPLDTTLSTAPVSELVDPAAFAKSRGLNVRLFVL